MALNPHFLQGSRGEQRLVQSLINEHLKIYGVEVTFIPRKFVNQSSIIEEVQASKFDDNFLIEAYVENYDGYAGAGDVLTKFGMSLRDEVTLTISKERFEEFIAPFMDADEDIDFLLTPEAQIRFNQRQDRLYLDIDWGSQTEGDFLVLDCFRALDPDEYTQVYNDPFVKRYFVALMKKQWGMNLIKFRGTKLPGGIELNGREIYDDGVRELEEIKSRMMMDYETPPLDFIG